ncbi:hypothetical protein ACGFSG_12870 [Streptomyces sp. NPDC048512]|uniref:hypothetical protein n=1 Tax=unclassified Streptomyces TaxID=2593676 RepID=UPI0009BDDDE5|nr:hypothetical protein [Streptomyces sp. M41(2017)]OQQ17374.1 hypothetical protein B0675_09770 [Streptomyces sp. M41(2017)]
MNRPSCLLASALTAGMLLSTAACSGDDGGASGRTDRSASPAAASASPVSASPVADAPRAAASSSSASASPAVRELTKDEARTALITNTDLGSQWTTSEGAATWRDALLKSKVDASQFVTDKGNAADCQQLLDGLYAEDLLGKPKGESADTGFDDSDDEAQMRYEVAAYGKQALDDRFRWLDSLPDKCDQFTAVSPKGGRQTVQVVHTDLDDAGDARKGLQIKMTGDLDDNPDTLTLDFAAVRVGDSALSLTNGGLSGAEHDSTTQATAAGADRLKDVLDGKSPQPTQG